MSLSTPPTRSTAMTRMATTKRTYAPLDNNNESIGEPQEDNALTAGLSLDQESRIEDKNLTDGSSLGSKSRSVRLGKTATTPQQAPAALTTRVSRSQMTTLQLQRLVSVARFTRLPISVPSPLAGTTQQLDRAASTPRTRRPGPNPDLTQCLELQF